jgi:hypothetical protein
MTVYGTRLIPLLQAPTSFTQVTPAQNTWYTILDTTLLLRIYQVWIKVATTGETLEFRTTIDGNVRTGSQIAVADTVYYPYFSGGTFAFGTVAAMIFSNSFIDAGQVKIEVRKTTASGTGTITGLLESAKW